MPRSAPFKVSELVPIWYHDSGLLQRRQRAARRIRYRELAQRMQKGRMMVIPEEEENRRLY